MSALSEVRSVPALSPRERDFLLLSIYFQMRHGYPDRAAILAEALVQTGDRSHEALLAQAITTFAQGHWEAAFQLIEAIEQSSEGKQIHPHMLAYMKHRCQMQRT